MTNEQPRLTIDKRSPALWAVTFANPPINLIDAAMVGELQQLLTAAETDDRLAVIVFDSADPEFFLCGLLTPSELQTVLGTTVSLSGGGEMAAGRAEFCTGQTSTATVMLRLVTGLDPGRDRSGGTEKKGVEMVKQMGIHVDVKTFGPITCSTMVPPANLAQHGFNTTCTVNKPTAVAGVEVTAKSQQDMVSIERLHPLAEKMASRF